MGRVRVEDGPERGGGRRPESDEEGQKGGVLAGLAPGRPPPVSEQQVDAPEESEDENGGTEVRGDTTERAGGGEEREDGDQRQGDPDAGQPEDVAEATEALFETATAPLSFRCSDPPGRAYPGERSGER